MNLKRTVEIAVVSDIHLGTYGCHAKEVLKYLNSIKPDKLILNGDIIDIWQFRKRYFPKSHLLVIKKILTLASKGTEVYYLTGNHDEKLRKFSDTKLGDIHLLDKLVLELDDKKAWFFHGDVFDASVQHAKWIAKLGGWGYDFLILFNRLLNYILKSMGREKYSLSKKVKNSVKGAIKFVNNFEKTATDLAIENEYDYVVLGHIHQPKIRKVTNTKGNCMYLNSGDWIENLTALEYNDKQWTLYQYQDTISKKTKSKETQDATEDVTQLLSAMMDVSN